MSATTAQIIVAISALGIATAEISFAVETWRQEKNATLVALGVAILRADPGKEDQINPAREWALDLIDANAGGVRFSSQSRTEFLHKRLVLEGVIVNGGPGVLTVIGGKGEVSVTVGNTPPGQAPVEIPVSSPSK